MTNAAYTLDKYLAPANNAGTLSTFTVLDRMTSYHTIGFNVITSWSAAAASV